MKCAECDDDAVEGQKYCVACREAIYKIRLGYSQAY